MTTAPRVALGRSLKRPARNSIVSRTKPALISEAICERWPAVSATEVLERLPSVANPPTRPGRAARHPLRDQLLVGVDLIAVLARHRAPRRQRFGVADEHDREGAEEQRAGLAPPHAGSLDREQPGWHVTGHGDPVIGQARARSTR